MSDNTLSAIIIVSVCLALSTCGVSVQWHLVEEAKIEAAKEPRS